MGMASASDDQATCDFHRQPGAEHRASYKVLPGSRVRMTIWCSSLTKYLRSASFCPAVHVTRGPGWSFCFVSYTENDHLVYSGGMKRRSDKVIGYLRVSTDEQAVSGLGLSDQRAVIAAEATRRHWSDIEFMADEGFSAKNLSRPAIAGALEMLRKGQASVLVVSKLDRLSRSLLDFATLMDRARREGWELVVLDLAIDTTVPSGQLMANVMAAFAEYERQLIGARTSAALQQLKAKGVRLGRPRTMPSEVTERVVRERSQGRTLAAIAEGLNAHCVPTARGGSRWYPSTVKAVLVSAELDSAA